ncbi:MAG: peptidase T, partial [Bacteroidaceae bacterium]|nr:peptidase T [Bacteroidaceae bacterium]
MDIVERFLNYVKFDSQSDENSETVPSSAKQWNIARYLKDELEAVGLEDIVLDDMGYVYATLPSNIDEEVPTVGFIAHYDTSPDCSGADIKPRIVHYEGGDIKLNEEVYT